MSRLLHRLALLLLLVGCKNDDAAVQADAAVRPDASVATTAPAASGSSSGSADPAVASADPTAPAAASADPTASAPGPSAAPVASVTATPTAQAASPPPSASASVGPPASARVKGPDATPKKPPAAGVPAQIATRVELVEAGAEPRKALRFAPKVGLVDEMTMTMTLAVGMDLGGRSIPKNALPPMVVDMNLEVTEVRPNGDVRYTFAIRGTDVRAPAGAPAQVIAPMKEALGRMRGLGGHTVMSNRGQTKEAKIDLPKEIDPQTQQILQGMEQAMNQIVVALPEEEVGVGAKWRVTNSVAQNGISLRQVLTYDLVKLEDGTAHCDVSVTQDAPRQKVAGPGGAVVDLTSLKSSGSGKVAFRLDHVAPTSSRLALSSALEMAAKSGAMKLATDVTVEMRSP